MCMIRCADRSGVSATREVLTDTQMIRSSWSTKRHSWRTTGAPSACMSAHRRRASSRSSGWVTSKNVAPIRSGTGRSSRRPIAALQAVITPVEVSTAIPTGAFSNALSRW